MKKIDEIILTREEAIKYLLKHSVYCEEWSGAGMWVAVESVMTTKGKLTQKYLNYLLKRASEF